MSRPTSPHRDAVTAAAVRRPPGPASEPSASGGPVDDGGLPPPKPPEREPSPAPFPLVASDREGPRRAGVVVGGRYELKLNVSGESFLAPPGALSEIMSQAIEQVTGRKPELSTTGGTSDARFIKDCCPVAEFGMVGRTMHKVDEEVALADIERLAKIYERILDGFFAAC